MLFLINSFVTIKEIAAISSFYDNLIKRKTYTHAHAQCSD